MPASKRCKSAAALSAAVDSTKSIGDRTSRSGGTNSEETSQPKRQPLFGREREEGKDSHSRQWRLSMAVFLNRNKRPSAAPIEVAELLSEKPPPPEYPPRFLFGREREGGASRREAASLANAIYVFTQQRRPVP